MKHVARHAGHRAGGSGAAAASSAPPGQRLPAPSAKPLGGATAAFPSGHASARCNHSLTPLHVNTTGPPNQLPQQHPQRQHGRRGAAVAARVARARSSGAATASSSGGFQDAAAGRSGGGDGVARPQPDGGGAAAAQTGSAGSGGQSGPAAAAAVAAAGAAAGATPANGAAGEELVFSFKDDGKVDVTTGGATGRKVAGANEARGGNGNGSSRSGPAQAMRAMAEGTEAAAEQVEGFQEAAAEQLPSVEGAAAAQVQGMEEAAWLQVQSSEGAVNPSSVADQGGDEGGSGGAFAPSQALLAVADGAVATAEQARRAEGAAAEQVQRVDEAVGAAAEVFAPGLAEQLSQLRLGTSGGEAEESETAALPAPMAPEPEPSPAGVAGEGQSAGTPMLPPPPLKPLPTPPTGVRVCRVVPGTSELSDSLHGAAPGDAELASACPFLLSLPDIDGRGITSRRNWPQLSASFEMRSLQMSPEHTGGFQELATFVAEYVKAALSDAPPERPVYLMGEGFGGVLAIAAALECSDVVNRLLLVNPSTDYPSTPIARVAPLLDMLPAGLADAGLPLLLAPALVSAVDPFVAGAELGGTGARRNRPGRGTPKDGGSPEDAREAAAETARRALAAAFINGAGLLLKPPNEVLDGVAALARDTAAQLQELAGSLPRRALSARLRLLAEGCEVVDARVGKLSTRTMIVAGGRDLVAPSEAAARALRGKMQRAFLKVLPDSGHAPLSEPGVRLLDLLRDNGFYVERLRFTSPVRRGSRPAPPGSPGPIEVPGTAETARSSEEWNATIRRYGSPVFFSTSPDGRVVRGLSGIPADERPLLFCGNHQLYAFDMPVMVEQVLKETGVLMRGLAHPSLFPSGSGGDEEGHDEQKEDGKEQEGSDGFKLEIPEPPPAMQNTYSTFGAVQVTPSAFYRLLRQKEAVLLYPGGVREGFKRKGEQYELFWPTRPEFVRMAARFETTVVPIAAIGLEDSVSLVLDSDEIRASPLLQRLGWAEVEASARGARRGVTEDPDNDHAFVPPLIAPSVPARLYFLFGRPIKLGRELYEDREAAAQAYANVKAELEACISYLLRARERDPYKDFLPRYLYENPPLGQAPGQAPTFEPR